jgi:hypothetical protein
MPIEIEEFFMRTYQKLYSFFLLLLLTSSPAQALDFLKMERHTVAGIHQVLAQLEKVAGAKPQFGLFRAMEKQLNQSGFESLDGSVYYAFVEERNIAEGCDGNDLPEDAETRTQKLEIKLTLGSKTTKKPIGYVVLLVDLYKKLENEKWVIEDFHIGKVIYRPLPSDSAQGASVSAGGGDKN